MHAGTPEPVNIVGGIIASLSIVGQLRSCSRAAAVITLIQSVELNMRDCYIHLTAVPTKKCDWRFPN